MSVTPPPELPHSEWCLAEPQIWELLWSYPSRCIHRAVIGKWGPWQSPLAGPKLSLASVLTSCGLWLAEDEDRESALSLIFLRFFKLARKLQSGQEAMCSFFRSLISPWSPACARENPLFCSYFAQVHFWAALGGARGQDSSRGWAL